MPHLPRKTTWQPAWKPSKKRCFAASPIDTATPQENQRLETRHVDAEKPAFRTRLPPIFTVGNMTKGQVLQLPPLTRRGHRKTKDPRQVGAPKRAFRARLPPIFKLCSFKINVFLRVFLRTWKFATSNRCFVRGFSVNFQHIAKNATPATEFAPCRHLMQPCQCDLQ